MPTISNDLHVHLDTLSLPILVSAVAVWVASALAWMLVGHHKDDQKPLPPAAEEALAGLVKSVPIPPGSYAFPHQRACEQMGAEEKKRLMSGEVPVGLVRVFGKMSMAKPMLLTFAFQLAVSVVVAFLLMGVLRKGAPFGPVFHTAALAGVLAHCGGGVCNDLWFQESRRAMLTKFIDGVVFGLIIGAVFGWLWPR